MGYVLIIVTAIIAISIFILLHKVFRVTYFSFKAVFIEILTIVIISVYCSIFLIGKISDMLGFNKKVVTNSKTDTEVGENIDIDKAVEEKIEDFQSKIENGTATISDLLKYNVGFKNCFMGNDFNDEVVWIQNSSNYYCIDRTGKILFNLNSNEFENNLKITDFSKGIAVVNEKYVINKSGNIVYKIENEEYDKIILQGEYSNKIYNGLVFIEKKIETFDKNEELIGVLDNSGEFIIEPTSEIEFVKYIGNYLYYIGNDKETNENIYLNAKNMEFYKSSDLKLFDEEYMVGNAAYKDEQDIFYYYNLNENDKGFYDNNYEKVIDISEYNNNEKSIINNPYFVDEYCILMIEKSYDKWLAVINKEGKRMFEPRKLDRDEEVGELSDGLIRISCGEQHYFINIFGEVVVDKFIAESVSDFSEGIAKVNTEEELYYIDLSGNRIITLKQKP